MTLIHYSTVAFAFLFFVSGPSVHADQDRKIAEDDSVSALFHPMEGPKAYEKLYDLISKAKKYVHVTVYSWSDGDLDKALQKALANGAKVRLAISPDIIKAPTVKKPEGEGVYGRCAALETAGEANGAQCKIAPMTLHEKFTMIDDEWIINTSANFSGGAKTKYSENMVFHKNVAHTKLLFSDFKNEFAVIWNVSKDVITHGEALGPELVEYTKTSGSTVMSTPGTGNPAFYSSSMNFELKRNSTTSTGFKAGKYLGMKKKFGSDQAQTWIVRDVILKSIRGAKKSIFVVMNHFNIKEISDELINAVKRGVNVQLAVDNQEYKSRYNPNVPEVTPLFVEDWLDIPGNKGKEPPVRVKYYSHEPSPRYWYLNHHKFVLIDYDPVKGSDDDTILISGSYNCSQTAEQGNFDSLVTYTTAKFKDLQEDFYREALNQWSWGRTEGDAPKKEILAKFLTPKNGMYPIHIDEAVSLTFSEIGKLRADLNKSGVAPGIFSGLRITTRDCMYFDPENKTYVGCPGGK